MTAIKSNGRRKDNKKVSTTVPTTAVKEEVVKPEEVTVNKKYALRTPQFEITECCGRSCDAVYYNPQNKVVQCHHCGHVYRPI